MAKFEISDAVSIFSEQASNITSLWTVYVAATFAGAVFSVQIKDIGRPTQAYVVAVVAVGFLTFAAGHLSLVIQALKVNKAISKDIKRYMDATSVKDKDEFEHTLTIISRTANPFWPSIAAHLIIDACVTFSLFAPIGLLMPYKQT